MIRKYIHSYPTPYYVEVGYYKRDIPLTESEAIELAKETGRKKLAEYSLTHESFKEFISRIIKEEK